MSVSCVADVCPGGLPVHGFLRAPGTATLRVMRGLSSRTVIAASRTRTALKSVVVRLGEELFRIAVDQEVLVEEARHQDRHDFGLRHSRFLRIDPLHPDPDEALELVLVGDGEGEAAGHLDRSGQRQRDAANVSLRCQGQGEVRVRGFGVLRAGCVLGAGCQVLVLGTECWAPEPSTRHKHLALGTQHTPEPRTPNPELSLVSRITSRQACRRVLARRKRDPRGKRFHLLAAEPGPAREPEHTSGEQAQRS